MSWLNLCVWVHLLVLAIQLHPANSCCHPLSLPQMTPHTPCEEELWAEHPCIAHTCC